MKTYNILSIDEFKRKIEINSRLLGIDPGKKNIGFAICDERRKVATPLTIIKMDKFEKLLNKINEIINDNNIKGIVIGNPINMDGSVSNMKVETDKFSKFIKKRYSIPVALVDERLTTREAIERINSKREYLDKRYLDKHSISAQIILESWLREQN